MPKRKAPSPLARFIKHVELPEHDITACWGWNASIAATGYAYLQATLFGKKETGAHRVSWMLDNQRAIPEGMCVCHTCDNRSCTNPAHLFLGTHAENMADMKAKDRQAKGAKARSGKYATTLDGAKVLEIRERHAAGESGASIAKDYPVSEATISAIVRRRTWKHI